MAFTVTALSDYTKENFDNLISSVIFRGETLDMIRQGGNIMTGIKSAEKIAILDSDAVFQAGGTCGFSASGTTTLTQRTITVGKLRVMEALCPKTLEAKATQHLLAPGSKYEGVPFEQAWLERKSAKINKQLEIALWQGDTASGTANLNKFDGLLKLIDAGSPVDGNTGAVATATGITVSNVFTIHQDFADAIPAELLEDDFVIFEGYDTFRLLQRKLTDSNLFHYTGEAGADYTITLPGTNIKVKAVHGLDGTNRIIGTRLSNLYYGTDLENEEEKFDVFFAKEADEVRLDAEWKSGVNVAFDTEVVEFTLV